jgi:phospholipid transport system transporter-binding protein
VTLQLPAAATLAEACSLLAQLDDSVDDIDAAALQAFDTSAVALLLEAHRRAQARGATLVVRNPPPKLVELAGLYGVDGLLSLAAT